MVGITLFKYIIPASITAGSELNNLNIAGPSGTITRHNIQTITDRLIAVTVP